MSKKRPIIFILLILLIGGGFYTWKYRQIDQGPVNTLTVFGNVDIREVDLSFNNSERLERLLVQEGDHVRKGQLLAVLNKSRIQAAYAAAQAKAASQKAVLSRLEAGSRPEEIRQARAEVAAAKARLHEAGLFHQRNQKLFMRNAVSRQEVDTTKATLDTSRAELKVAREALALAIKGPRREDIEEARAMLMVDEAQRALAAEVLKDTELYAPADGIVRNRILEPGDMASPQTPVLTLAKTDPLWVRSYAPETVLGRLVTGMRAVITTDSAPGKNYSGWIGFISPTAEFTPKNVETPQLRTRLVYQVRVYVCNPQQELRLGMPATVRIALDQPRPAAGSAVPACGARGSG